MELSKIVMGIMGLVIGAIVLATLLIPVVTDVSATEDKFTNEGYWRMSSIDSSSDDTVTIFWDHTNPENITVNGELVSLESFDQQSGSVVFSDDWTIRYLKQGSARAIQYYGTAGGDFLGASVSSGTDMTITLSSGVMTAVNTAETPGTKTASYDTVYYANNNGSYIMKKSAQPAYVNVESTIIVANGLTVLGSVAYGIYFEGTVDDGLDFSTFAFYSEPTVSNVAIVSADVSDYVDLVSLDKVTFTLTDNGGNTSVNAVYSYFLVPYEVTAERVQHMDAGQIAIIAIVPLMCMVALVMVAVRMISGRSD